MSDGFLALRVRELMARPAPDGKRWTSRKLAAEATRLGYPLTASYVQSLANGNRTNPTLHALESLQAVFGVPLSSLLEPAPDGVNEIRAALAVLHRAGPDLVRAKGTGVLSPASLDALAAALRDDHPTVDS